MKRRRRWSREKKNRKEITERVRSVMVSCALSMAFCLMKYPILSYRMMCACKWKNFDLIWCERTSYICFDERIMYYITKCHCVCHGAWLLLSASPSSSASASLLLFRVHIISKIRVRVSLCRECETNKIETKREANGRRGKKITVEANKTRKYIL